MGTATPRADGAALFSIARDPRACRTDVRTLTGGLHPLRCCHLPRTTDTPLLISITAQRAPLLRYRHARWPLAFTAIGSTRLARNGSTLQRVSRLLRFEAEGSGCAAICLQDAGKARSLTAIKRKPTHCATELLCLYLALRYGDQVLTALRGSWTMRSHCATRPHALLSRRVHIGAAWHG